MEIKQIEQNLEEINYADRQFYLLGTAHVSKASVEQTQKVIEQLQPDCVAVELCQPRYGAIQNPNRWRETDIVSVIKSGKSHVLLAQFILAGFQKSIGQSLDVLPGAEMLTAIESAKKVNAKVELADREVRITLKRTWAALSFWTKTKLMGTLLSGIFSSPKIKKDDIEKLKAPQNLDQIMQELIDTFPDIYTPLIDERDKYLAMKIKRSTGQKVVAVVGAGHIPGIKKYFEQEIDLAALEELPEKKLSSKIIGWMIPISILAMLVLGFFKSGSNTSLDMIEAWALATGLFSGIGAALVFSHPLSVIAAIVVAPVTSVHPLLAAGWASGLVEAYVRKPQVSDLENLGTDISSLKGILTNRVSRVLLVVAFTNIGCSIGALIGIPLVASLIG